MNGSPVSNIVIKHLFGFKLWPFHFSFSQWKSYRQNTYNEWWDGKMAEGSTKKHVSRSRTIHRKHVQSHFTPKLVGMSCLITSHVTYTNCWTERSSASRTFCLSSVYIQNFKANKGLERLQFIYKKFSSVSAWYSQDYGISLSTFLGWR